MARYPFPIRNRGSVVITAPSFRLALSKICALYPNKFIKTKFAKNVEQYLQRLNDKECVKVSKHNGYTSGSLITDEDRLEELTPKLKTKLRHKLFMDLINARKEAAKKSANNNGKAIYINVDEDGECLLMPTADTTTFAAFKSGHEIAVPIAPQLTKQISKHKPTKKMKAINRLPDEEEFFEPEELDLPQGVELPKEEPRKKAAKKAVNGSAKKAAKVVKMTAIEPDEEQPTEDSPKMKVGAKRPKTSHKAKPLTVKKLAKKGKIDLPEVAEESEPTTKKSKRARAHPVKVKRSVKLRPEGRKKTKVERKPKLKPSALDVQNARKQLAQWKTEREQYAKENPKRQQKKAAKGATKKPLPLKETKPLKTAKKK